jgi:hypothetical protein
MDAEKERVTKMNSVHKYLPYVMIINVYYIDLTSVSDPDPEPDPH